MLSLSRFSLRLDISRFNNKGVKLAVFISIYLYSIYIAIVVFYNFFLHYIYVEKLAA